MKNYRKSKNIIIVIILLIGFITVFFTIKNYSNKDIKEYKEINKIDSKRFKLYLEQENGEYSESKNVWPGEEYSLNQLRTSCVDNDGNSIGDALSYSNGILYLTTNKSVFCNVYFDIKADIAISVSTNGNSGELPSSNGYKASLTCDTATGTFNQKYQRIEISGLSSDEARCSLNYSKDTNSYTTLKNKVETSSTTLSYNIGNYSTTTTISQSEYGTPYMYYMDENLEEVESTENWYTFDGTKWVSNFNSNDFSSVYNDSYSIKFSIQSGGYYQICYSNPNEYVEDSYSWLGYSVYRNDGYLMGGSFESETENKCINLTGLNTSDYIEIYVEYPQDFSNEISFYFKKTNDYYTKYHYRYTGKQPNNYIWFNNELWRIIGSIPTCTTSDCKSPENLVKIIRDESIGGLSDNGIFNLLNNYYYGKKDGTSAEECTANSYPSSGDYKADCDYRFIGISNNDNDYFSRMLKNVYWYSKVWENEITASEYFEKERIGYSGRNYIGLMSASDYGFASGPNYNITLNNYSNVVLDNWLFGQGYERTYTTYNSISPSGGITDFHDNSFGAAIRPVVYLNSSVYIISGTGTQSDPYIIGM